MYFLPATNPLLLIPYPCPLHSLPHSLVPIFYFLFAILLVAVWHMSLTLQAHSIVHKLLSQLGNHTSVTVHLLTSLICIESERFDVSSIFLHL